MKEQIESYVFDGHFVGPPLSTVFTFFRFSGICACSAFVLTSRASEK